MIIICVNLASSTDQNILWLHVPMNNFLRVQIKESLDKLLSEAKICCLDAQAHCTSPLCGHNAAHTCTAIFWTTSSGRRPSVSSTWNSSPWTQTKEIKVQIFDFSERYHVIVSVARHLLSQIRSLAQSPSYFRKNQLDGWYFCASMFWESATCVKTRWFGIGVTREKMCWPPIETKEKP